MSRKPPSDAFTRFTSTAPHSSRTQPSTSQPRINTSGTGFTSQRPSHLPPETNGETPAEKVARLRAAARQAKERASLSTTDRIIARGRFWSDVAHRVTTYGLLAFTGISSVVAVYGLVSLVSHNRRQKRAWIEREMGRLHDAQQAFLRGEADAEQLHLLEQERAGEELARKYKEDKEKRKAEDIFGRIKGTFGNFLGQGDKGVESASKTASMTNVQVRGHQSLDRALSDGWIDGESAVKPAAVRESHIAGVGLDDKGRPVPINMVEKVRRRVEDERRSGEKEVTARTGISGGPLDILADNVTSAIGIQSNSNNRGWWSWLSTGGKSS